MDPPSPTKPAMAPDMPIFPASPERAKQTHGTPTPQSPSHTNLRMSPLRSSHRRNDSDVSVQSLAARFESLEVKDFKEAQQKYARSLERMKMKQAAELQQLESKYTERLKRQEARIEQMMEELRLAKAANENVVSKEHWDKQRQEYREAGKKWEETANITREAHKQALRKIVRRARQPEKELTNKFCRMHSPRTKPPS